MILASSLIDGKAFFEKMLHLIDATPIDGFGKVHNVGPAIVSFIEIIDS
jgi:hypothetical protein